MDFKKDHIDHSIIEKYISGKMSDFEQNQLEKRAESDPFLKDALEGYAKHPSAIKIIKSRISDSKKLRKSFFGSRTIAVLSIACLAYLITLFIHNEQGEETVSPQVSTINSTENNQEIEVLPESIDSFIIVEKIDQISITEIVENKVAIEKIKKVNLDSIENIEPNIIIDEKNDEIDPDEIEDETYEKGRTVYAPSVYMEDFYVVDYRELNRERKKIHYTKYVLSGVPANYEDHDAKDRTDLIEEKVEVPYIEYLEKSMYYFSHGKFKKALNRYLTIIEQYPQDLNAHFYGALCYFNTKKHEKALDFLNLCLEFEEEQDFVAFRQEVKWYKAKVLIKLKKINEAHRILDEIIIEGLFYSKEAISLKKEI